MNNRRILNGKGEIIGTWDLFKNMNEITLAYNLGDLSQEELQKVPICYIMCWEKWREEQEKMYIGIIHYIVKVSK